MFNRIFKASLIVLLSQLTIGFGSLSASELLGHRERGSVTIKKHRVKIDSNIEEEFAQLALYNYEEDENLDRLFISFTSGDVISGGTRFNYHFLVNTSRLRSRKVINLTDASHSSLTLNHVVKRKNNLLQFRADGEVSLPSAKLIVKKYNKKTGEITGVIKGKIPSGVQSILLDGDLRIPQKDFTNLKYRLNFNTTFRDFRGED